MAIYQYRNRRPEFFNDPRRAFYEQDPRTVFTNWLYDIAMPEGVRETARGLLFDRLYARWIRELAERPDEGPQWFGDYLYGQSPQDLQRLLAQYPLAVRGFDPRRFGGRARWVAV